MTSAIANSTKRVATAITSVLVKAESNQLTNFYLKSIRYNLPFINTTFDTIEL